MEESRALKRIQEAADLIGMIEDLTGSTAADKLSSASWAGLKITLRNVRESLVQSHEVLANDLVARARGAASAAVRSAPDPRSEVAALSAPTRSPVETAAGIPALSEAQKQSLITRKDLRASLEKFVAQGQTNS